jgi:predicted dehydrogenase
MITLRVGILGCGGIAHKHAQAMVGLGDQVEMIAFCDRDESRARAFSDRYAAGRASVFIDHRAMLDQAGFMYRFGKAVSQMKQVLDTGTIGPAGLFSARYFCNALRMEIKLDGD